MTEKVPMTAQGHAALEAELKRLRSVERQRIIKAIAEARSHGDLSENAEYHAAKEAQGMNEAKVADLEDKLSARRRHRYLQAVRRHREVRRHRDARRRGHRREGEVPDRRRFRGRCPAGADSPSARRSPARLSAKRPATSVEVNTPRGARSLRDLEGRFQRLIGRKRAPCLREIPPHPVLLPEGRRDP